MKQKIAILGGSFNPPHAGHYQLIKWLVQDFDKVIIIPNQVSPHKIEQKPVAFYHRFHLLKLMLRELDLPQKDTDFPNSKIILSDIEYGLSQPSYSWKTLQELKKLCDSSTSKIEFHWIIGFDQLLNLHKWSNIEYLAQNCYFTVFRRKIDGKSQAISNLLLGKKPTAKLTMLLLWISTTIIALLSLLWKNITGNSHKPLLWKNITENSHKPLLWKNITENSHKPLLWKNITKNSHKPLLWKYITGTQIISRKTQKMLTKLKIRYNIVQNELINVSSSEIRDFLGSKAVHSYAAGIEELLSVFGFVEGSKNLLNSNQKDDASARSALVKNMLDYINLKKLYKNQ